jgi:hypothetical protein
MPAASKAQQRLMAAAEHGADFPMAKRVRRSMTRQQLHDFASGPMKGKPERTPDSESSRYDFRSRNNLKRGRHAR